jgi:hypothetical protein
MTPQVDSLRWSPDRATFKLSERTMYLLKVIASAGVIASALCTKSAVADGFVSDYLRDGWDIKALTQVSSVGYTQIILQKGTNAVICTIYYSAKENRWTAVDGCSPVP